MDAKKAGLDGAGRTPDSNFLSVILTKSLHLRRQVSGSMNTNTSALEPTVSMDSSFRWNDE